MKIEFNQVTWYSKLAAFALIVALPFLGFWLGMKFQEAVNPITSSNVTSTPTNKPATNSAKPTPGETRKQITTDQLSIKVTYQNGVYYYSGTIQLPNPCYELIDQTEVTRTDPQVVNINLKTQVKPGSTICVQMLVEKPFSGQVSAPEGAVVNVYLNDKLVK